ncbi:TIGR04452 family lipoprotein [Leptospira santarosai]|uniref:TIGR04452 family lipoprotein n=1 Tax=Leptospira santarosai TaxID=28183 RepID=UPI000962BC05|nr:TIGR04452 family lipoprotein [Leptospira santarosai]ASV10622.1 lipoprotein [Leptospira santarosai]MBW9234128.1 TIGR04452 family lipoprotein [Leptospira santarosai]MDI7174778.1 TIGR04452 family lipoprotein [Leptospira santarosai]MDI7194372.1 TIGR04452 family lipoprotein [Leptospira santarosai]MDO6383590.1 TIGR04452 family lipoprotein [Leptospira santarosai]
MINLFKKTLFLLQILLIVFILNCNLMNESGLSNDRIKGSEVKQKIDDASQTLIIVLASYDKSILTASNFLLNMSASKVAGIDSNAYYDKKSVDNCLEAIQTWGYLIRSPGFMALTQCRLKPEKPLY